MKKAKIEKCKWVLRKPYLIGKKDDRYKQFNKCLKKTGVSPDETWSLDYAIAEFVLPRLKLFREIHGGYPYGLTDEKWNDMLDKMIFSFEWVGMETNMTPEYLALSEKEKDESWKKYEEGMKLFGDYFMALWW